MRGVGIGVAQMVGGSNEISLETWTVQWYFVTWFQLYRGCVERMTLRLHISSRIEMNEQTTTTVYSCRGAFTGFLRMQDDQLLTVIVRDYLFLDTLKYTI